MTSHINIYYVIGHVITQSVLEMGSFVSVVNSAALMQKYETGLYLLTAARALIVVL